VRAVSLRSSAIASAALPRGAWLLLAAALSALPSPSRAAEVTEVADAMDEGKPIQLNLDVAYRHVKRDTRLSRENLQADASGSSRNVVLVDELQHAQTTDELGFRVAVGLFHDLELHVFAPLVLRDLQTWDYATVNGQSVEANSTLKNNHLDISGCLKAGSCSAAAAPIPIVPTPGKTQRSGFRDPTIGVAWGPINEEREARLRPDLFPPGKPVSTWVVGFDYTLPLPGDVDDPSKFGASSLATAGAPGAEAGKEAKKAHVFTLWTAFSKRFKVADPYVVLRASAPVAVKSNGIGDGAYDNCWHPDQLADVATANCANDLWKNKTGYQPPYEASFTIGTELALYEDARGRQKFAIDVHGDVRYVGPGRTYTEITDALGKLTYAEEHVGATASIGLYGRAATWLQLRVAASAGIDSAHFITTEPIGKDFNNDGRITLSNGAGGSIEQSPTYDFRLDQVGHRLRAEPSISWGVSGTLAVTF